MTEFIFGRGRQLFTHIKRHRPDIGRENNFDCLEAHGIETPNIDSPSEFNNWELFDESSLEALPTDFENSDIISFDAEENAAIFVHPFSDFLSGAKMLQGDIKTVLCFLTYHILFHLTYSINIRVIMILVVMNPLYEGTKLTSKDVLIVLEI
jgi:hypothetical protein